jgi:DNA sulfur modification protein DndE
VAIEHIRLSQQGKDQLIKLKRVTGIEHWNVLCRWALCMSLAESRVPPVTKVPADSNLEMSWKVFGGRYAEVYLALLKERCVRDGFSTDPDTLSQQLRLHMHRGISYLAADKSLRKIDNIISLSIS